MPSFFDDDEQSVLKPKAPGPVEATPAPQGDDGVSQPVETVAEPQLDGYAGSEGPVIRGFDPQPMQRLSDIDPRAILAPPEKLQPFTAIKSSMRDRSLESIGVKWADHKDEKDSPKPLFDNDVGF